MTQPKARERRAALLREFEMSGLSLAEFCRWAGLAYSTVLAWRRRAREEGTETSGQTQLSKGKVKLRLKRWALNFTGNHLAHGQQGIILIVRWEFLGHIGIEHPRGEASMISETEFSKIRQQTGLPLEALEKALGYSRRTLSRYESGAGIPKPVVLDALRRLVAFGPPTAKPSSFKFIDLFAGIGGLRRGFDAIGGKCVFTSEWNSYSQQTYRANFNDGEEHAMAGDITAVAAEDIPEHDILLAGFPCQPFSIAGVSKKNALGRKHGFACEAQGTLFFDAARIIAHHRPRAVLLENVKNLVNHDKGNTFRVIHDTLKNELGYKVCWKVIDAKSFVPQHRERIFIACFRDDNDFTFNDLLLPDPLSGPKLGSILHPEDGSEKPDGHYTIGKKATVSDRYTLTDHLWNYLQGYAEKHRLAGNGFGFGLCGPESVGRTLSARYYKDGSELLVKQAGKNPRRLTPRECARLMGFDKPGGSEFKIPVSDTQAYKQFGNAVVVPVVEAVARHMAPYILDGEAAAPFAQMELALYLA